MIYHKILNVMIFNYTLFYLLVVDNVLLLLLQYIGKHCDLINLKSRSHDLFLIGFPVQIRFILVVI